MGVTFKLDGGIRVLEHRFQGLQAHIVQVGAKGAFPGRRNPSRLPVYLQAGTVGERHQADASSCASFSLFFFALGLKQ